MDDLISRQAAIDALRTCYDTETITMDNGDEYINYGDAVGEIEQLPPIQPDIVRCKDCKHNPKLEWFGCPMSHLNEKQRPETAWCWKAERRTDE